MSGNKESEGRLLKCRGNNRRFFWRGARPLLLFIILISLFCRRQNGENQTPKGKIIYPDSLSDNFGENEPIAKENNFDLQEDTQNLEDLGLEEEEESSLPSYSQNKPTQPSDKNKSNNPRNDYEEEEEETDFKPGDDLAFNLQRYGYSEININSRSKTYKQTPLMKAASWGDEKAVRFLLERGANINLRDKLGRTALHLTIWPAHAKVLKILLEHGAKINIQDNQGNTPLHLAVIRQNEVMVGLLLEKGAALDITNHNQETPLEIARKLKNQKIIEALENYAKKQSQGAQEIKNDAR